MYGWGTTSSGGAASDVLLEVRYVIMYVHIYTVYKIYTYISTLYTGGCARGDARAVRHHHGPHGGGDDLRGRGGGGGLLPGGEMNM